MIDKKNYGDIIDPSSEEFNLWGSPKLNNTIRYLVDAMNEVNPEAITASLSEIAILPDSTIKGDGLTDDTFAIQSLLNKLPINVVAKGIKVKLPSGKYKITSLTLPNGVQIEGDIPFDPNNMTGTWFYCVDQNNSAIILNSGSSVRNVAYYYPEQSWYAAGSKPLIAYPATIKIALHARRMFIEKIFFLNSYYGIDADRHHESLTVQDVNGYCMNQGLVADYSSDIDRFINVHFNYNALAVTNDMNAANYGQWTRKNGTAFTIKQADWTVLSNCFAWGYRKTYVLAQSANGSPSGVHFSKCGADATGQILNMSTGWGIDVSEMFGTCFYPTVQFGNTEAAIDTDLYAINISGGSDFSLNNSRFWGISKGVINLTVDQSNIIGNIFKDFGSQGVINITDYRAINLTNGQHNIIGNQFKGNNYARVYGILMNTVMTGATIVGNSFWNFAAGQWCIQSAGAVANFDIGVNNYYNCPNTVGLTGQETNHTEFNNKDFTTTGTITATTITATNSFKVPSVASNIPTGTNKLFVDSADNKLKFRDSAGAIRIVNLT
jgi:hypothetical protein